MANSKARSRQRPASTRSARTVAAARATPTSAKATRPAPKAIAPEPEPAEVTEEQQPPPRSGQPLWLQLSTLLLAVLGLAISAYETYAHFNGNRLAGCPAGAGTFNCSAVITSSQSMVFGIFPVAILGLAFYVAAVPLFSPWGWRAKRRLVHQVRLASVIVGMGFVLYLIYAELQIGSICEYCTGVHAVTFLLFCVTVISAAIWGLGGADRANPGQRR